MSGCSIWACPEHVTLDVTNVYRLRFDFAQVATTPVTEPSAGSAKVLCD